MPLTMLQLLDKLGSNVKSESDNRSDPKDVWISPWSGRLIELLTGLTGKVNYRQGKAMIGPVSFQCWL